MGLPSGTFSYPIGGRLELNYQLRPLLDGSEYAGGGSWNVRLRAYADDGTTRHTTAIDFTDGTATLELAYEADVELEVGLEAVDHTFDGTGEITADQLRVTCRLWPDGELQGLTLDQLLARLRANLQPMSATPQVPRWLPDIEGDEWYVRPLSDLADVEVNRFGFTGEGGGAVVNDEFGRLIDPTSIVAFSTPLDTPEPQIPMTAIVWPDDPDSITLRDGHPLGRWFVTYRCVSSSGDGSDFGSAWAGFQSINWAATAPGDILWVCGTFEVQTLVVQAGGAAGAKLKIRLWHPTVPGRIYQGRVVQDTEWVDAGTGEWYLTDATAPNNMLYEDGERMFGMSITSRATANVTLVSTSTNELTIRSLRPVVTGTPLVITGNINLLRIPAPLERQTTYYAILVSGPPFTYTLQLKTYVIKLALTPEDAAAGTAIDLTAAGDGQSWYFWTSDTTYPFLDPVPGSLAAGQFGYDAVNARIYYKPSSGTPADHEVRWSRDQGAEDGACIYIDGYDHINIEGGGEYGGMFGVPPVGECSFSHLIPIVTRNCTDILVDGLLLRGCRHAVGHRETANLTVRNCDVDDVGWHALGSDQVAQVTGCPDLVIERNRCRRIGLKHDWGDVQGIITTPLCHRYIFRRNFIQECARNEVIINTGTLIVDSSDDGVCYLNWSDDFSGVGIVTAPGPDGPIPRNVLACNIFTRGSNPDRLGGYPDGPVHGRVGSFALVNQNTDTNDVSDLKGFGNIVAHCSVPYTAVVAPTEHLGHVHIRTANLATVEVSQWERNAFLDVDGLIYCIVRQNVAGGTPHGTIVADRNLYSGLGARFYDKWDAATTLVETFDSDHIQGPAPDYWSGETGNDVHAAIRTSAGAGFSGPTPAQLEILRLHDQYDTYDKPTVEIVGNFPFTPA